MHSAPAMPYTPPVVPTGYNPGYGYPGYGYGSGYGYLPVFSPYSYGYAPMTNYRPMLGGGLVYSGYPGYGYPGYGYSGYGYGSGYNPGMTGGR
jgi:hypothetical protein